MLVTYEGDIFTTKLPQIRTSRTDKKLLITAVNKSKKRLSIVEEFKIGVWNEENSHIRRWNFNGNLILWMYIFPSYTETIKEA